ncbi:MAG TPA: sulfate/thiosulfate ABC transporter permease CysW, partial [Bradyrhizobium sp.]|nr:sulfate/thiosulfate ABC transporter permease CysW [Bradyrhizobium sp.]
MSTKSNLATLAPPAPPLQVYIPAAGLVISQPAAREADDRARAVASPKDLRTEPGPIRFIIIALAVTFLTV